MQKKVCEHICEGVYENMFASMFVNTFTNEGRTARQPRRFGSYTCTALSTRFLYIQYIYGHSFQKTQLVNTNDI